MNLILGIDPGTNTGIATFINGRLSDLKTFGPHHIERIIRELRPDRVVFEDSRMQSYVWTKGRTSAEAAKMARNVGQIDAWCALITAICEEIGIPAHGISPKSKGAKLNAEQFKAATGWAGSSNEHNRDACMVAWPYRGAK